MKTRQTLTLVATLLVASCAHVASDQPQLIGAWNGTSGNAVGSSFSFRQRGDATWLVGQPFEIKYVANDLAAPTHLDLSGFQSGPLKDRTLYCLIELAGNTLRMDCEPSERPAAFNPEQTQVFTRHEDGA